MNVFENPAFTFPQTIHMTGVDRKTIENWMNHGHVRASGEAARRDRRFSIEDMLRIVLMSRLREAFKVEAATAGYIAADATLNYGPRAENDLREVWQGGAIGATDYRPTYGLSVGADGEKRAAQRDDHPEDGIMIIIPVGLIARSLFAKAKIYMDETAATDGGNTTSREVG